MASTVNAAICAMVVCAFWALLGYAVAFRLLPRVLAIGAAPVIGWAVHNAVALPIFVVIGFSPLAVAGVAIPCFIASIAVIVRFRGPAVDGSATIPPWTYFAAAALALAPAAAIAPKVSADSVQLAAPIFDHSKIAIIDAITRLGLPPVNPFFGEYGELGQLAYYYLYYVSAAQASIAFGVSGWEADIALTWFAAFSSLTLMMGIAVWLAKRSSAAILAVALACGTSLRELLWMLFGIERLSAILAEATGFAGWLFQAAWVPQHLMSASCVVVAMLLLAQYAQKQTVGLLVVFTLVVVAGFESSTYVGGVTFVMASLVTVPILLVTMDRARRRYFLSGLIAAALVAAVMAAPFLRDQIATVGQRGTGFPIYVQQFDVLSEALPFALRRWLDLPAYWLVLLPIEFPAAYIAGSLALVLLIRSRLPSNERTVLLALATLCVVGLAISWLLVGDVGGNNDLRMRAVLPAAIILIATAAAGVALQPRQILITAIAIGGLLLSLPHTFNMIRYNFTGDTVADSKLFARTPELWAAVRKHAGPDRRVGNNILFLKDMTPWPVNISWALLANRSSCFSGNELAVAYVSMPRERREAINAQFIRVFEGKGTPDDVSDMARRYACDVVIVTAEDKTWDADPFASSPLYRLVETKDGQWRIYKANPENTPNR